MRRRYRVVLILGAAAVTVGTLRVYFWSNGPASATITPASTSTKGASTQDLAVKQMHNDYFDYQLSSRFVQKSSNIGAGNPLFLQQLYGTQVTGDSSFYPDQLALTIGTLPGSGIAEVSDVKYRNRNSDYEQLFFEWLPAESGVAYQKKSQGYELDLFLIHKNKYVSFAITGMLDKRDDIIHEMNVLVGSILWADQ